VILNLLRLKAADAKEQPSTLVFLYKASWLLVAVKYFLSGLDVPFLGVFPDLSAIDFAIVTGILMGVGVGRKAVVEFASAKTEAAATLARATVTSAEKTAAATVEAAETLVDANKTAARIVANALTDKEVRDATV